LGPTQQRRSVNLRHPDGDAANRQEIGGGVRKPSRFRQWARILISICKRMAACPARRGVSRLARRVLEP